MFLEVAGWAAARLGRAGGELAIGGLASAEPARLGERHADTMFNLIHDDLDISDISPTSPIAAEFWRDPKLVLGVALTAALARSKSIVCAGTNSSGVGVFCRT